jgi:hypothetical protein
MGKATLDGEATLDHTLRELGAILVADAPLAVTLQRVADLGCGIALPIAAVELSLADGRGRPMETVLAGVAPPGLADTSEDRLSTDLVVSGATLGTVTLYAREPGAFTAAAASAAEEFAAHAAVVLANARAYWELHDVAAGLQAAMQSRAVIEQAKGKLMATEGCSADEAFMLLARASQRENVKLRELARRFVDEDGRL